MCSTYWQWRQSIRGQRMLWKKNHGFGNNLWNQWTQSSMCTWVIPKFEDIWEILIKFPLCSCFSKRYCWKIVIIRSLHLSFAIFNCNEIFDSIYALFLWQYLFVVSQLIILLHQLCNFVSLLETNWS